MFTFICFVLAVVFFVLWVSNKNSPKDNDKSYLTAWWDGYRAMAQQVRDELSRPKLDREALVRIVDSAGQDNTSAANTAPTVNVAPAALESAQLAAELSSKQSQAAAIQAPVMPMQYEPIPEISEEELAEAKERQSIQNLNVVLYVASFLLVAAAALFVFANAPVELKLLGLWSVTIGFYACGLWLHHSYKKLRPAAVAFIGTGLAILPFAGLSLHLLAGVPPELTWLFTSLIGFFAFMYAAVYLKSQVVSYLTLAFVLSVAASSVSVTSGPIVMYFVVLIVVSLCINIVALARPKWIPEVFVTPIDQAAQIVTPLTMVASLTLYDRMQLWQYELIFAVGTLHYAVIWIQRRDMVNEMVTRALSLVTLLIIGADIYTDNQLGFAAWWLVILSIYSIFSLVRVRASDQKSRGAETTWIALLLVGLLGGIAIWAGTDMDGWGASFNLAASLIISLAAAVRFRNVLAAIPALIISCILPFVFGRWAIEPSVDWYLLASLFCVATAGVLVVCHWVGARISVRARSFLYAAFWLYAGLSFGCAWLQQDWVVVAIFALMLAALTFYYSYMVSERWPEIVAGILIAVSVYGWVMRSGIDGEWKIVAASVVSGALVSFVAAIHHRRGEVARRNGMLSLGLALYGCLVFTMLATPAVKQTGLVLFVVASLTLAAVHYWFRYRSQGLQSILAIAYLGYAFGAWLLSWGLGSEWAFLAYATMTLVFWAGSYLVRVPWLMALGHLALLAALAFAWQWSSFDTAWSVFGIAWIAAAMYYLLYWLSRLQGDNDRATLNIGFTWIVLIGVSVWHYFGEEPYALAAGMTLAVTAVTVMLHGYVTQKKGILELGVYLGFVGMQRLVSVANPEIGMVFYAHWLAITIACVAWWLRKESDITQRLIIAVSIVTFATGIKALTGEPSDQIFFLVEHIILLLAGALTKVQWALWWGVAASIVAVLYFLKDSLFLVLAFLGVMLILIVIWRLSKSSDKNA